MTNRRVYQRTWSAQHPHYKRDKARQRALFLTNRRALYVDLLGVRVRVNWLGKFLESQLNLSEVRDGLHLQARGNLVAEVLPCG